MAEKINYNNILTLQDEIGPFGSPFVDSARTAVTEKTTEALQVVFLRPSLTVEESKNYLIQWLPCSLKYMVVILKQTFIDYRLSYF